MRRFPALHTSELLDVFSHWAPDSPELTVQSDCATCTLLLDELLDQAIEIRIAGTKASREEVPTTLGNPIAVRQHVELTSFAGRKNGFYVQTLLDEDHETRDLDLVVLSHWAVNDFDLHCVLQTLMRFVSWPGFGRGQADGCFRIFAKACKRFASAGVFAAAAFCSSEGAICCNFFTLPLFMWEVSAF